MKPFSIKVATILYAIVSMHGLITTFLKINNSPIALAWWVIAANLMVVISCVGLWRMKKWSVYLFFLTVLIGGAALYASAYGELGKNFHYRFLLYPVIFGLLVFPHWKKLNAVTG